MSRPGAAVARLIGLVLVLLGLAGGTWLWWGQADAPRHTRLYVAEPMGDRVLVLDTGTGRVLHRIDVGRLPHQLVPGPKDRLYVLESGSQSVSVIDTRRDQRVAQRLVGPIPDNPAHRALGDKALREAGSCKACHGQQVLGTLPGSLSLSKDERTLWVTELRTRRVTRMNAATLATEDQLGLLGADTAPTAVMVQPKTGDLVISSRSYRGDTPGVSGIGDSGLRISLDPEHAGAIGVSNVLAFDASMDQVKGRLDLPWAGASAGVFSSDGRELYMPCRGADRVAVLGGSPLRLLRHYRVPAGPAAVALVADDLLAVACLNTTPGTVELLDRATGDRRGQIQVPANPASLAWDARSKRLYVGCTGAESVAEVDLAARRVVREHAIGAQPAGLALVAAPTM